MKKVLFVDERYYRFSFYYAADDWWISRGIIPIFKAYEKCIDKWLIYFWVIFSRPYAVVFVQLSRKNFFLCRLCNIFKIKTFFWQHGVFIYDQRQIKKYRKFNCALSSLLCFSNYDAEQILKYFKKVDFIDCIAHYDINKISSEPIENSVFYVGQILTSEQVAESASLITLVDKKTDRLLSNLWEYLDKNNIKVYLKKHPGDKSQYLEKIAKKYSNFCMTDQLIMPSCVIGHYSTLILPYMQLDVPFYQVYHPINVKVILDKYANYNFFKINDEKDFYKIKLKNYTRPSFEEFKSISKSLEELIRE